MSFSKPVDYFEDSTVIMSVISNLIQANRIIWCDDFEDTGIEEVDEEDEVKVKQKRNKYDPQDPEDSAWAK